MAMTKTPIEIDDEALAAAAEVLGTKTTKDTVNAALREVSERLVRLRALEQLGEMADRGDFDEFIADTSSYQRTLRLLTCRRRSRRPPGQRSPDCERPRRTGHAAARHRAPECRTYPAVGVRQERQPARRRDPVGDLGVRAG